MKELNQRRKNWMMFAEAVKEARRLNTNINGFDIFVEIRVHIGKSVFDLNPYLVDLKHKSYLTKEINMITGRRKAVELNKMEENV